MIELQNIQYKSTKGETLLELDHQFELNQFHVILGPSGAGKTILLELLAGLVQPSQGEMVCEGTKVTNLFPEVRKFGYLPQDNVLFPHLTVRQNVEYSLNIKGIQNQTLVEELGNRLKINHLLLDHLIFLIHYFFIKHELLKKHMFLEDVKEFVLNFYNAIHVMVVDTLFVDESNF